MKSDLEAYAMLPHVDHGFRRVPLEADPMMNKYNIKYVVTILACVERRMGKMGFFPWTNAMAYFSLNDP